MNNRENNKIIKNKNKEDFTEIINIINFTKINNLYYLLKEIEINNRNIKIININKFNLNKINSIKYIEKLIKKINKKYKKIYLFFNYYKINKNIIKKNNKYIFIIEATLENIKNNYNIINNIKEKNNIINEKINLLIINKNIKNKINKNIIKNIFKKYKIIKINRIN